MPKRPVTLTIEAIKLARRALAVADLNLAAAAVTLQTADARTGKPDPSKRRKRARTTRS